MLREWRAGCALRECPQVLAPLDVPALYDGIALLAFPCADGGDLIHAIMETANAPSGAARSTWAGRLSNLRRAAIDLVAGLAFAHSRGWFHRCVQLVVWARAEETATSSPRIAWCISAASASATGGTRRPTRRA